MALIWDGNDFQIVPEEVAKKLVKEDKAQFAEGLQGTQLKFREEFSGYSNKVMTTGTPKKPEMKSEPEQKVQLNKVSNKAGVKQKPVLKKPLGLKKISGE